MKQAFLHQSLLVGATALFLLFPSTGHAASFANGADISWVDQEEASGYVFRDDKGVKADPFSLLKNGGMNAIRLRVWVDPAGGWCNAQSTLRKAQRAVAQGQRIMIDFHYSDSWADPGKQTMPSAWVGHDAAQLSQDVYRHTHDVLGYLKSNGIPVEWVEVGNEINGGMLWPQGSTVHFTELASLLNSGYAAVKATYPDAKVVLHLANGYDGAGFRQFFDQAQSTGVKWDVIGMSHYPPANDWLDYNSKIATTMHDVVQRYGKPVIVSEVGMDWQQADTAKSMIADLIDKTRALGSDGLGVFYWEPDGYPGWNGYKMGAVNQSGQFTKALDAFQSPR